MRLTLCVAERGNLELEDLRISVTLHHPQEAGKSWEITGKHSLLFGRLNQQAYLYPCLSTNSMSPTLTGETIILT